jgi:hypothetical protein
MKNIIQFFKKLFSGKKKCECPYGCTCGKCERCKPEENKSPDIEIIEKKSEIVTKKKPERKKKNEA